MISLHIGTLSPLADSTLPHPTPDPPGSGTGGLSADRGGTAGEEVRVPSCGASALRACGHGWRGFRPG
eukprot:6220285-Prymnesium_polylepis.1